MTRPYGPVRLIPKGALLAAIMFVTSAAQARPLKLLVFGDSLAAGYGLAASDGFQARLGAALRADGRDVQILDGGVSGDTSAGGRSRLDWALGDGPDAVLVEFGGNDGLRGTDPKAMETNLAVMLDTLAAKHLPTLLTGMFPPPNLGAEYTAQFRAVFDRLGRRPGLLYDPFFLQDVAAAPALNQADHIHPNPEGVKRIVARITPLVEKLLDEVRPE